MALLLVGLERIPSHGWNDGTTATLLGSGAAFLVAFVVVELRIKEPLLDLRLFRDRNFSAGNLMVLISTGALMGILFMVPLMLQQLMGLTATESGLVTLAQVIGMMFVMPLGGMLYPRLGARLMMGLGFTLLAITIFAFAMLETTSSLWAFRGLLLLVGVSMGLIMVPSQTATFETISHADTAKASSLFSTMRQFASAAGVAVLSTVLTARINANTSTLVDTSAPEEWLQATFSAYEETFMVSAIIAVIGIGLVFVFRKNTGRVITPVGDENAPSGMTGSNVPAPELMH